MPCLGIILLKCHENCRTLHRDQETNVELLNIGGTIMKKMMMMAMMMVMTMSANAMSYTAAKKEALFLSDKMAYELNLTASQYEDVYEINLDYLMNLNGRADVFGIWWDRRNTELRYVLNAWQYDKYITLSHFYRPVAWKSGGFTFAVYSHYNRGHFYNAHPKVYVTYKGGNHHKPAVRHEAPMMHNSKPAVHNDKKHGTNERHMAMATNNNRSKSGHFLRPVGSKRP